MGVVYRATQLSLNRTVALKILATELSQDKAFRERFRREGLLQAAIDHEHIVTVYEAGETEHGLFLAMRLIRGPTLKDMILSGRARPGAHAADPRPGGRRARHGSRRGAHPPRHQAAEHPHRRQRPRLPGGLRADAGLGRGEPHRDGPVHRHDRLRGPGADPGPGRHGAKRRLLARRGALRGAHRGRAVPASERGGRALRPHLRAAAARDGAAPRASPGDRRRGRPRDGQGAGRPVRVGRRAGRGGEGGLRRPAGGGRDDRTPAARRPPPAVRARSSRRASGPVTRQAQPGRLPRRGHHHARDPAPAAATVAAGAAPARAAATAPAAAAPAAAPAEAPRRRGLSGAAIALLVVLGLAGAAAGYLLGSGGSDDSGTASDPFGELGVRGHRGAVVPGRLEARLGGARDPRRALRPADRARRPPAAARGWWRGRWPRPGPRCSRPGSSPGCPAGRPTASRCTSGAWRRSATAI